MINFKIANNPKNTVNLEVWLETNSNGDLTIKACSNSDHNENEGESYFLLIIRKDGYLELAPSIPEYFGLKLDEYGRLKI